MRPVSPDIQNPANNAPPEIFSSLRALEVPYVGFDGNTHAGEIIMHESLAADVQEFFALAASLSFPIQKIVPIHLPPYLWDDERSCEDNNASGFNFRYKTGSSTEVSNHGLGCAFDVNPLQNPYIRYTEGREVQYKIPRSGAYELSAPGTLTATHPLVLLLKERGWDWGGDWKPETGRTDYQHFQKRQ